MDKKDTWLFLGATFFLFLLCFIGLDAAFKPLLFAWVLSYFCMPLFDKLENIGMKREISAFIILLLIILPKVYLNYSKFKITSVSVMNLHCTQFVLKIDKFIPCVINDLIIQTYQNQ